MLYSESIIIRTHDCDMGGHWKPSSILESMQEAAIAHCDSLNLGRPVLDSMGIAWVLSRCRVEMKRLPHIDETCTVSTWAMPTRHLFFPRAHAFKDAEGAIIGEAYGLWLLMDKESRKAVSNPLITAHLPIEQNTVSVKVGGAVRHVSNSLITQQMTPQYTDFDLNGHVNNAKYMDWCWNALGAEALTGRRIAAFDVEYDREVRIGEKVRTALSRDGETFSFCGFMQDGTRCFGIRGGLAEI